VQELDGKKAIQRFKSKMKKTCGVGIFD